VQVQVAKINREQKQSRAPGSASEVRLNNGRSLVVAPEFDANHLRALLAVGGVELMIALPSLHTLDREQAARIWLSRSALSRGPLYHKLSLARLLCHIHGLISDANDVFNRHWGRLEDDRTDTECHGQFRLLHCRIQ
jgi:hypothetical protein